MTESRTLEELQREEDRLLEQVRLTEGTVEARTSALAAHGVFRSYTKIHSHYVELAETGDFEALKRAIFLQWFEVVEPPFLTGIQGLDKNAVVRAIALIEQLCAATAIDDELAWMLPYYYLIADWAFPSAEKCPHFIAYCKANEPKGLVRLPARTRLEGRGQMGDYWRSMQRSRVSG